jgi:hypothetical protein
MLIALSCAAALDRRVQIDKVLQAAPDMPTAGDRER